MIGRLLALAAGAVLWVGLAAPVRAELPDLQVAGGSVLRPEARPRPVPPLRPLARPTAMPEGSDTGEALYDAILAARTASAPPLRPVARSIDADDALRDRGTWLAVAVLPPGAMVDRGQPLDPAAHPVLAPEARISTRSLPVPNLRLARVEATLQRLTAPTPAVLRLSQDQPWTGPAPLLRPASLALQPRSAGAVMPGLRPALRSPDLEARIAASTAQTVHTAQMPPGILPAISPQAVALALIPPARTAAFEVMAAAAPAPRPPSGGGQALTGGNGLCGVPILAGRSLGNVGGPGQCGVSGAVEVTAVGGIRLSTAATVDCATATALAEWVRDVANPAVGNTGGGLARLEIAGSYACRGRNNQAGARLSEHAFGHAIDISGFRLQDGTRLTVTSNWGNAILRQMHRGACGIFGTVLGPDANAYHRDHFHFDTARYRSGSYCQ